MTNEAEISRGRIPKGLARVVSRSRFTLRSVRSHGSILGTGEV